MKLTDEERNSLVILQLEKAKVFLKQADEMFDLKYWDIASNRYYYSICMPLMRREYFLFRPAATVLLSADESRAFLRQF